MTAAAPVRGPGDDEGSSGGVKPAGGGLSPSAMLLACLGKDWAMEDVKCLQAHLREVLQERLEIRVAVL